MEVDEACDAEDGFALFVFAEARELDVSNAESVQLAWMKKFQYVALDVLRMPVWPSQEAAPYVRRHEVHRPDTYLCPSRRLKRLRGRHLE